MANTAAKKITYDGKPVQVESAVRDGTGVVISTEYVRHAEYTVTVSTSQEYHKLFTDLALGKSWSGDPNEEPVDRIPRVVEVFDASGNQIFTEVKIEIPPAPAEPIDGRITIYPTAVSPAQTWTVRVTAW
jgi:hypothetical protein